MPALLVAFLSGLSGFATRLLGAVLTEKMIAHITFYFLERWVQSTDTNVDNELLESVKKAYYKE